MQIYILFSAPVKKFTSVELGTFIIDQKSPWHTVLEFRKSKRDKPFREDESDCSSQPEGSPCYCRTKDVIQRDFCLLISSPCTRLVVFIDYKWLKRCYPLYLLPMPASPQTPRLVGLAQGLYASSSGYIPCPGFY